MPDVKRTIKIVTESRISFVSPCKVPSLRLAIPSSHGCGFLGWLGTWGCPTHDSCLIPVWDPNSGIEGFPLRQWSVEIHLLNDHGEPVPASVFPKVTYHLHPSFEQRATQIEQVASRSISLTE
ncbi:hypothetical protein TESG_03820 [Trichophyton tonsurans CBS 112818]|uniref:YEATS domain-containing protein n=1 Tax=Trichophyton tonsurans (strain CBS 112818) TaxID=647933 RepID=F2RYH3_TRIT1|nr:hypothetical protein TESG_03820 [Trichophyton tonsurans CBS 112818]